MQHFCFCSHFHEPNSKISGEHLAGRQQEGPPALPSSLFTPKMAKAGYATKEFLQKPSQGSSSARSSSSSGSRVTRGGVMRSWGPLAHVAAWSGTTHWTCEPLSVWGLLDRRRWQRAMSHSHWREVDQQSTGHNQQPDPLNEETRYGRWIHPPDPPNTVKLHILEAF